MNSSPRGIGLGCNGNAFDKNGVGSCALEEDGPFLEEERVLGGEGSKSCRRI